MPQRTNQIKKKDSVNKNFTLNLKEERKKR